MHHRPINSSDFRPRGKFKNSWLKDDEFCVNLLIYAAQIREYLEFIYPLYKKLDDVDVNYYFDNTIVMLQQLRWAHPIKCTNTPTDKIDRTKAMLIGPLFTSEEYPWPRLNGKYREPVCQFDLDEVGSLEGTNLGSGILQLWLGPDFNDYEIRVIPKSACTTKRLTPVPKDVDRKYFEECCFFAGYSESWLDPVDGGQSLEITGNGQRVLVWPQELKTTIGDLMQKINKEHKAVVKDFAKCLANETPSPTPHFFGNFSPIQYSLTDMPPCLLALESQGPFFWGDCGNAQIFYIQKEGAETQFTFSWTCC